MYDSFCYPNKLGNVYCKDQKAFSIHVLISENLLSLILRILIKYIRSQILQCLSLIHEVDIQNFSLTALFVII